MTLVTGAAGMSLVQHADAGGPVRIMVFMENSVGSPAQAQPYVDKLVDVAKSQNGWSAAEGKFVTRKSQADRYIAQSKPSYGIFSLGAFLGMRKAQGLEVIGFAEVDQAGGRKYHVISKSQSGLAGCKSKSLATNHGSHKRYIEKVVADGAFTLADFQVTKTTRPVQTLKAVISGDAECALIDNAQLSELAHIPGGDAVKPVWSSAELPPMAVVAFSGVDGGERAKFKASLGSLCTGAGKNHCDKVGIKSIGPAEEAKFAAAITKYGD